MVANLKDTSNKALAIPIASPDAAAPAPLAFFTQDSIEKSNKSLLDHEEERWRLLGFWERQKLKRHVAQLARRLKRCRYNQLIIERHALWRAYKQLRGAAYINEEAKAQARARARVILTRARMVKQQLDDLKETHASYNNYRQWLEYERKHHKELKADAAREKRIRKEMRQEAKWIEMLIVDVYRKTPGCHHIYKDGKGNEITRTPHFDLSQENIDAHYFWLSASKRNLLGWRWQLPYGVTISRLIDDDVIQNIKAATKREVSVQWSASGQLLIRVSRLDSPDALPKMVKWRDAMRFRPDSDKMLYPAGVGIGRKFVWFDFDSEPHILIGGKSQSGKSVFVNNIVASLVSNFSPSQLRFILIDQKGGMEFTHWSNLPHLLGEMIKTLDGVQPALERINAIMRKRMELLERAKAKDLKTYNARVDEIDRLPRLFMIIDELSTFVGLGKRTEDIHNAIMLLVSQGRAVGIHVIAATQHPEVKVVPGRIKTNMGRFSFAMPSVSASMIILDGPEAARLPMVPGRVVAVSGLRTLVLQSPKIDDEDIANVISAAAEMYPDVSNELREMSGTVSIKVWDAPKALEFALLYMEGQLSGQKMHRMLGNESPGERHLAGLFRSIRDQAAMGGALVAPDGTPLMMVKNRKAYYAVPQSGNEAVAMILEGASD